MLEVIVESNPQDCNICGWHADSVHTSPHQRRCQRWKDAIQDMSYRPMVRADAESRAQEALDLLGEAETEQQRLEGGMRLMRALYDRSLGSAIDNKHWREHPSFDAYVTMLDVPEMPEEVRNMYPHQPGHIGSGFTLWEPDGSRARSLQMRMAHRTDHH